MRGIFSPGEVWNESNKSSGVSAHKAQRGWFINKQQNMCLNDADFFFPIILIWQL